MRDDLKQFLNKRIEVVGKFIRYGTKNSFNGTPIKTVLLCDIYTTDGIFITDHMWFTDIQGFDKLGKLKYKDMIQFEAQCQGYAKGYGCSREFGDPREWDYHLTYLSNIKLL